MPRGRLVYSSTAGGSGSPPAERTGATAPAVHSPGEHAVRVRRERAGRAGKTVTTAGPLFLSRAQAEELLAALKRSCGSGGTLKLAELPDGRISLALELQGDHADRLVAELERRGFPAKRAGG